jgi:ribonuclease HI
MDDIKIDELSLDSIKIDSSKIKNVFNTKTITNKPLELQSMQSYQNNKQFNTSKDYKNNKDVYYVVKCGKTPGIYGTWTLCKEQVEGFKGAIYKKFETIEDAKKYLKTDIKKIIEEKNSNPESRINKSECHNSTENTIPKEEMERIKQILPNIKYSGYDENFNYNVSKWNSIDNDIYIFTDGSFRNNKIFPNSGIGIYLGYNCNNIKEQYTNKTNNQCELIAINTAFLLIIKYWQELSQFGKTIKIVSDSQYAIKACSLWLFTWKKNNWKTSSGDDVKNRDIIELIDKNMYKIKLINTSLEENKKIKVKLIHMNSHQTPDIYDKFKYSMWFGNYIADSLANNSI